MESLRAALWNSCPLHPKKECFFWKKSVVESPLMKPYGDFIFKTFARKNSYSENSQEKCAGKVEKLFFGNAARNFKVLMSDVRCWYSGLNMNSLKYFLRIATPNSADHYVEDIFSPHKAFLMNTSQLHVIDQNFTSYFSEIKFADPNLGKFFLHLVLLTMKLQLFQFDPFFAFAMLYLYRPFSFVLILWPLLACASMWQTEK